MAEGAADVVPQTTERGGGGLQGREAAPDNSDHHRRLISDRTATPYSYGAADAGTQAVAVREHDDSRATVDVQAGAGTSRVEANAVAVAVEDERLQFGTPRSSRTAWADGPSNDGGAGLPQGLRWFGRLALLSSRKWINGRSGATSNVAKSFSISRALATRRARWTCRFFIFG